MDGQKSTNTPEPPTAVDPEGVALSLEGTSILRIVTSMDAVYTFPDINAEEVKRVLPESGRIPANQPSLMLLNASLATLLVPFRIVKEVTIDEELVWASRV